MNAARWRSLAAVVCLFVVWCGPAAAQEFDKKRLLYLLPPS